jgi:phospholipid/cholesterol/gamma-HCH transport system ATP-binding protein
METPLIEFKNVTKRFGSRTILDQVNLKIYEGQISTIIGKSGTGKSVLLKHIIGLLSPDEGSVLFRENPIGSLKKSEWDAYRVQVSYMFQNNALFDSMTVYDNVALPLQQTMNLSKTEIERRVMARIEQTELTEVTYKYPSELSGGMQKRVALSRALVTDPTIVLFDEPTTGQDPIRKNAILAMIAEYQSRILALYNGKIVFQGTPEELDEFEHPFKDEVIQSLEGFQEELTGLYSQRHFKVRYQTDLSRKRRDETYAIALFTLEELEAISNVLGHTAAQEIIRALGAYIDKHFGAVGGFSTRHSINEFVTVLPYSDLDEAGRILEDFAKDFQDEGIRDIESVAQKEADSTECIDFTILAGLAQGKPFVEMESIIEFAKFRQEEIARFQCELRR